MRSTPLFGHCNNSSDLAPVFGVRRAVFARRFGFLLTRRTSQSGAKNRAPHSKSNPLLAIQKNRHRPVVNQTHLHHCLKDSSLNFQSERSDALDEVFIEFIRLVWLGGLCIRRPAPATNVAVERELRNDEHLASDLDDRAVHLFLIVLEDSKI